MTLEYQRRTVKFEICIFDALKVQALSDVAWKRSVHCNPPPKGKRRARGDSGKGSSEPKSITASQRSRVKEFPEECLAVTGAGKSKLFYKAFREELGLNKNCLTCHPRSTKLETVLYNAIFSGFLIIVLI